MSKKSSKETNENDLKTEIEQIVEVGVDKLEKFPKHPFKVVDETLEELKESISSVGITTPLVIREKGDGNYEIISGHRRKRACELLGIKEIPCIVRNLTDNQAILEMVDSNIQREDISYSEKAFAYKMKLEAQKHQGRRCGQDVHKTRDVIADGVYSGRHVQRYVRLTELIEPILQMVDEKKIAFNPAVELSYLTKEEQTILLDAMDCFEATPSLAQAQELKRFSQQGILNEEKIDEILGTEKANQIPKYQITYKRFEECIPRNIVTPKELEDYLYRCAMTCKQMGITLIELNKKKEKKMNGRDAR